MIRYLPASSETSLSARQPSSRTRAAYGETAARVAMFADDLGLPTVWIPHSYASCSQHAPNEHMLAPVARDALRLMAGLMWDLGEPGTPLAGAQSLR